MESRAATAAARAASTRAPADRPRERRGDVHVPLARAQVVRMAESRSADGSASVRFVGYASVTETPYEMFDWFGSYTEVVTAGAFRSTLANDPSVEFVVNHARGGQIPMAHTRNGTLRLAEDDEGLRVEADLDPARHDVHDMLAAIERGDLAEMSFRFRIDSGLWSPDYTEFRIDAVDLDRGDVSAVNFGASPHTHIDAPAREMPVAGTEARDESSAAEALGDDLPAEPTENPIETKGLNMPEIVELAPVVEPNSALEAAMSRIADLEERMKIRTAADAADVRSSAGRPGYDQVARVGAEVRTYRQDQDPRGRGRDFLTDVASAFRGDFMARERLERHTREELVERGARVAGQMQRATSTANFTGWVLPQYLVDLNAEAVSAGRPFADVCNPHDLPEQGMTCYLSKITTASSVADQSSEGATVSETSMDDTQISIGVRTASGSQTISRQAVERGLGVDDVTVRDLIKRYNANLDSQIINVATSGLTNVATAVTYTDTTPTAAELYPKLQEAASGAETTFKDMVSGLVVVMHSRRWRWLSAAMTSTWPFVSGLANSRVPAESGAATLGTFAGVRGYLPDGTPVVTDQNIATNLGTGTNEDEIYIVNPEEAHLWEDPNSPMLIRAETNPKGLQLDLVLYGYYGFYLDRYTGGHRKIAGTGLVTPTFA